MTKTVTVTKSNNAAYPGALVALMTYNPKTQLEEVTEPVAANASGVATLNLPVSANYYGLIVQPAAGDFTHALFFNQEVFVSDTNQAFSAKLAVANFRVHLKDSKGQDAKPATYIAFPATGSLGDHAYRPILRTGAFGIDLSTSLSATGKFSIDITANSMVGEYGRSYGLKTSKPAGVFTPVVYSDQNSDQVVQPGANSIYELSFRGPNISGQLKKIDGSNLSFGSDVQGGMTLYRADSNGAANPEQQINYATINADGSWAMLLDLPVAGNAASQDKAGKYIPYFYFSGSKTLIPFYGNPFWLDASGDISASESGPFVSLTAFVLNTTVSAETPNFVVNFLVPNSTEREPSDLTVHGQGNSSNYSMWFGSGRSANGLSAWKLNDGVYSLWASPIDQSRLGSDWKLTIDGGQAILKDVDGVVVAPGANGEYTLRSKLPNLKIKVINPQNLNQVLSNAYAYGWDEDSGNDLNGNSLGNGLIVFNAKPGVYDLSVEPNRDELTRVNYQVTVSPTGTLIRNLETNESFLAIDGVFELPAGVPNLTGSLVDESGAQISGGANLQLQKYISGKWVFQNKSFTSPRASKFHIKVTSTGTYRLVIRPNNSSVLAKTTTPEFTISDLGTLTDLGNVAVAAPLFKIQFRTAGGSENLAYGNFVVSGTSFSEDGYADASGWAGISVPTAGTYSIEIDPPYSGQSVSVQAKTYELVVSNVAGVLTPTITGVSQESDGSFVLRYGVPNVTGRILTSNGGVFTANGNRYANIQIQKYFSDKNQWNWSNYSARVGQDGTFGANIDANGTYRLRIQPSGVTDSALTLSESFEVTDANRTSIAKAFGDITLRSPLAKLRVRLSGSTLDIKYAQVEIRKDNVFMDWADTSELGVAAIALSEAGTYQFVVHPEYRNQNTSTAKTYTATVTGTTSLAIEIQGATVGSDGTHVLYLGTPNVTGKLVDSAGAAVGGKNNNWASIQAQKYDSVRNYWDWSNQYTNATADGSFGLSLTDPGTYRLRMEPYGRNDIATTYSESFTLTSQNIASFSKNFGSLTMNAPTLRGKVVAPDGSTVSPNTQVLAIDDATGQEMWEYSRGSDANGNWSMMLPKGSYSIYARAPWGQTAFGSSEPVAGLSVNSMGVGTFSGGQNASSITLQLQNPTWSGVAKEPGSSATVMNNVQICLGHGTLKRSWNCTETNSTGQWSLSKPFGFTAFDDSSELQIRETNNRQFAEKRLLGKTAIEAVLGSYSAGQTYANITVRPTAPNAEFTVTAGSTPQANIWVNLDRPGVGWVGGGSTDANGKVRFYVPDLTQEFNVTAQADGQNGLRGSYATTRKTYQYVASRGVSESFADTVELATPNFKGYLSEVPAQEGSLAAKVQWSWVEIYSQTTGHSASTNTDSNGFFATLLKPPASGTETYRVTVRPGYGSSSLQAKREYTAVVNSSGVVTLTVAATGASVPVGAESLFNLTLGESSVRGGVYLPDGTTAVPNSWVLPFDIQARQDQWQFASGTDQNGAFGMALPDGSYRIQADAPNRSGDYVKSASCAVSVANGVVATLNNECVIDGQLKLKLRTANLKFKLVKPKASAGDPDVAVPNAYVGVSVGNWHSYGYSNADGTVSLMIDEDEIANRNPSLDGAQDIHVWVSSPGESSDIVAWNCNSGDADPICKDLQDIVIGQPYLASPVNLGSVQYKAPNVTIQANKPDGSSIGSGAWVTVLKEESGWKRWMGSASTNTQGKAVFNLENTLDTDRFTVELQVPWNLRQQYAQGTFEGLTFAQLSTLQFAVLNPNLTLSIKQSNGTSISRWAWVQVERVNSISYATTGWLGGYGSDEAGVTAMTLPLFGTYKLTVNPGPESVGARTSCVVSVNGSGVVSLVESECGGQSALSGQTFAFRLASGNVQGFIYKDSSTDALEGAVVIAEAFNVEGTVSRNIVQTSNSDATGKYGLQLDPSYTWKLRVAYVNQPDATVKYGSISTPRVVLNTDIPGFNAGTSKSENFNLGVLP